MLLSDLFRDTSFGKVYGPKKVNIRKITDDSRKVKKGSLFVAIKGKRFDAHQFIPEVLEKGATAVVGEVEPKKSWLKQAAYIKVDNSRKALSLLASVWYGNPAKSLKVIGVTGTKGKTTVAHLIYWLLKKAGKKVGLISTIYAEISGKKYSTGLHVTNPEPLVLHKFLSLMVKRECEYAILEVTSHGLDQERVAGINFYAGILTNISHEHLDYHKTIKNYINTKAKLFEKVKVAILNKDDKFFDFFKGKIFQGAKIITYAIRNKADYKASDIQLNRLMSFDVREKAQMYRLKTRLLGEYNALNILAACALARELGISWESITSSLLSFPPLPGRLEEVKNKKGVKIYIDFAHTPDSLEKVLKLIRKIHKEKRLISVFGCAGERDILKRPLMGEISAKIADFSVFTGEDPRSEKVETIISQIEEGAKKAGAKKASLRKVKVFLQKSGHFYFKIPDRGEAIFFALEKLARPKDVVVICGKGHEKSFAINQIEYPWSDKKAVRLSLEGKILKIAKS